jgi:formylmethanofuran dehydrogenase subunit B
MSHASPLQHADVTCTACACLCDDLQVRTDGQRVTEISTDCRLARDWFRVQGQSSPPLAAIRGKPVGLDQALGRAVELIRSASSPLVYGLSRSSTPGQRAAVALADLIGATIDTTASLGHASSVMAVQQAGEQTCSLGEVRNRADVVIYWGADPLRTHPRHGERYALDPAGEFIAGRSSRYVIVVDVEPTASTQMADEAWIIERNADFELLLALRLAVRGEGNNLPERVAGIERERILKLADRLRGSRFGVVFFGYGLSRRGIGHHNVEALLRLVRDLNDFTRFYARRMRVVGDVTGADLVLAWQTGYPFAVNLGRGYPRYNPGEFSAWSVLERGETDLCILLGSETLNRFSPAAREALARISVITLDHPHVVSMPEPEVRFTTGVYGINEPGTAYRMDEVPLPLRAILPAPYPSDAAVLDAIVAAVRSS